MTMEKKQSVIGIGEALFDVLPEGKKLGGAPANFAYHVFTVRTRELCGQRNGR